jgi:hypothetical protein
MSIPCTKPPKNIFFSRKDNWRRHMLRHKLENESEPSQQVVDEEIKIEEEVEIGSPVDEIEKPKPVD